MPPRGACELIIKKKSVFFYLDQVLLGFLSFKSHFAEVSALQSSVKAALLVGSIVSLTSYL